MWGNNKLEELWKICLASGAGPARFLAGGPVWPFFWDSTLCLFLADPFKFTVGLLAQSEIPGISGGVSL